MNRVLEMRPGFLSARVESDGLLTVGQLARLTGVSIRTIRYYEELEILPQLARSRRGQRRYPENYRFYVEGALALRGLGFTLDEVRALGQALSTQSTPEESTALSASIANKQRILERRVKVCSRLLDSLRREWSEATLEDVAAALAPGECGADGDSGAPR